MKELEEFERYGVYKLTNKVTGEEYVGSCGATRWETGQKLNEYRAKKTNKQLAKAN